MTMVQGEIAGPSTLIVNPELAYMLATREDRQREVAPHLAAATQELVERAENTPADTTDSLQSQADTTIEAYTDGLQKVADDYVSFMTTPSDERKPGQHENVVFPQRSLHEQHDRCLRVFRRANILIATQAVAAVEGMQGGEGLRQQKLAHEAAERIGTILSTHQTMTASQAYFSVNRKTYQRSVSPSQE